MSQLPQIRRLLVEDFLDQKDWISKLFSPINTFMDGVVGALTKGITLRDNCVADVSTVLVKSSPTVSNPLRLAWGFSSPPLSVHVGKVERQDAAAFTLTAAVGIQWAWDSKHGLTVTNLLGVTPSTNNFYYLTFVVFGG